MNMGRSCSPGLIDPVRQTGDRTFLDGLCARRCIGFQPACACPHAGRALARGLESPIIKKAVSRRGVKMQRKTEEDAFLQSGGYSKITQPGIQERATIKIITGRRVLVPFPVFKKLLGPTPWQSWRLGKKKEFTVLLSRLPGVRQPFYLAWGVRTQIKKKGSYNWTNES